MLAPAALTKFHTKYETEYSLLRVLMSFYLDSLNKALFSDNNSTMARLNAFRSQHPVASLGRVRPQDQSNAIIVEAGSPCSQRHPSVLSVYTAARSNREASHKQREIRRAGRGCCCHGCHGGCSSYTNGGRDARTKFRNRDDRGRGIHGRVY